MDLQARIKEAFKICNTDKLDTHHYEPYYAEVFANTPASVLEIGVLEGKSLAAWRTLFPDASLYGVDVTPRRFIPEVIDYANAKITFGDSTKHETLAKMDVQMFDVIIDDGSHFYKNIMDTFDVFHHSFASYYVIEDVMYQKEEVVDHIKKAGFNNVTLYPSKLKNVPVDKNFLANNSMEKSGEIINVDLHMIVVKK